MIKIRICTLILLCTCPVEGLRSSGGSNNIIDELMGSIRGTVPVSIDDTTTLSLGYDLRDTTDLPGSALRSISISKQLDISDKEDTSDLIGKGHVGATMLLPSRSLIYNAGIDLERKQLDLEVNDAAKSVTVRAGRDITDRLRFVLSPMFMYGRARREHIDFRRWLPRPQPAILAGMPSLSVDQGHLRADWANSFSTSSRLHGLAIRLSWRTGENGACVAKLIDARNKKRLWTIKASFPMEAPSRAKVILERQYQVRTTSD